MQPISGNVTINAVETALLSHGDECAFVVASIKDTASITFKYTADNQLYWGGAEDFVFNDKNRAISVRCTFGSNGRYCFFASSGYPAVSGYSLPIASADTLGGVQPVKKTEEMTVPVGVDAAGGLWAALIAVGGSNVFHATLTLEEAVKSVTLTFPTNWENIKIFNIHASMTDVETTFSVQGHCENKDYKSWFDIQPGADVGINIFGVQFAKHYFAANAVTSSVDTQTARPSFGTTSTLGVKLDARTYTLYSNTADVLFPAGTVFEYWGVSL